MAARGRDIEKLGSTNQYMERRGFERLYFRNPDAQARYVQSLLGHRAQHTELGPIDENSLVVVAVTDILIKAFTTNFPDYLQTNYPVDNELGGGTYNADPDLVRRVQDITETL